MLKLIFHTAVNVLFILGASALLSSFNVTGAWPAFWFILVLTLVNWTIVPIVQLLALPITIFTFGLFYLIINLTALIIVASSTAGIEITGGFFEKYFTAFIISIMLTFGNLFVKNLEKLVLGKE